MPSGSAGYQINFCIKEEGIFGSGYNLTKVKGNREVSNEEARIMIEFINEVLNE